MRGWRRRPSLCRLCLSSGADEILALVLFDTGQRVDIFLSGTEPARPSAISAPALQGSLGAPPPPSREEGPTVRLDWSDLPPGATKIIQEITQEEHTGGRGHDTGQIKRTKFKLYSKLDALEKLGRHLSMFTDKVKIEGTFLDDLPPDELADLVKHLKEAGFGGPWTIFSA